MTLKIVDIGDNFGMSTFHIFSPWNPKEIQVKNLNEAEAKIQDADLVCFGGGGDIHPSLYGHRNVGTSSGPIPSYRDNFEKHIWDLCVRFNKPKLGICRGAQLACALSGGFLIQDVNGHSVGGQGHEITTHDGKKMYMTSLHHQMMVPFSLEHKMLAWTPKRSGRYSWDAALANIPELDSDKWVDPEVVYFSKTNALGIQGHPEFYDDPYAPPVQYTRELVAEFLNVQG